MFEQMGATVSYDAGSKTATVSKPGAEIKVTVGKPEVVINGESRPLDVPPMIYQGACSCRSASFRKAWAHTCSGFRIALVVVRYIPATPPPRPGSSAADVAPPPATAAADAQAAVERRCSWRATI